jgi:hypothetical protein
LFASQRFAFHLDSVRRRNQSVHDGVGDGGFADDFVPVFCGKLTGHDGGASALPVFEDFEEVSPFTVGKGKNGDTVLK